jgi:hypothetical protein
MTVHKLLAIAAWASLAFIAYPTLSPIQARPKISSADLEHIVAFAVTGLLFYLAYCRSQRHRNQLKQFKYFKEERYRRFMPDLSGVLPCKKVARDTTRGPHANRTPPPPTIRNHETY